VVAIIVITGRLQWNRHNVNGKRYRRSTDTTNKKLAEQIYAKVIVETTRGLWFGLKEGEDKTFQDLSEKYMKEHSLYNKKPSSHKRDKILFDRLNEFFGEKSLTEISPKDIHAYKMKRRNDGVAPKTINNELILMGHAFNLAMKQWEWVDSNPVARVPKERVFNVQERWLTREEEKRLLTVSPKWLKEIIIFAVNTGLRQDELLSLRWPQIDIENETLTILEQKNNGRDILPLNKIAMGVIMSRLEVRSSKTDIVFYGRKEKKRRSNKVWEPFKNAVKRAKIEPLRFHDLRHTFATRLVQAGVDLYMVQKLGRWKTHQMVMRYAHHYPESLRPGVRAIEDGQNFSAGNSVTIVSQSGEKNVKNAVEKIVTV